jgi:thiamine pyrophosphokinase
MKPLAILAIGGLGGRIDQAFSLLNQLYKVLPRPIFLISPTNISFLLHPGRNIIHAPRDIYGPCCGIIPISGPATITLDGFRWDLSSFPPVTF